MAISQHLTHWQGRPLVDFNGQLDHPQELAYALRIRDTDTLSFEDKLKQLVESPRAGQLETLVVGTWTDEMYDCDSSEVVQGLCSVAARLPALKHLFLGEITYDEFEISWIVQSDLSPLLRAYPQLQWLNVRGGSSLSFAPTRHENLRGLVVESGGLPRKTLAQIFQLKLPALEYLELWLGSDDYGGDSALADLDPLLRDSLYPRLTQLGLCNAEYTDDIVLGLSRSAVLDRIQGLDLSRGTLGDDGCALLLANARFASLKRLDLSDNYLSHDKVDQVRQRLPFAVIGEQREAEEEDGDRYCSVSE